MWEWLHKLLLRVLAGLPFLMPEKNCSKCEGVIIFIKYSFREAILGFVLGLLYGKVCGIFCIGGLA